MSSEVVGSAARVWPLRWAVSLVLAVGVVDLLASRLVKGSPSWPVTTTVLSWGLLAIFGGMYGIELALVWAGTRRLGQTFAETVGMRWRRGLGVWVAIGVAAAVGVRLLSSAYTGLMLSMRWYLPGWNTNPTKYFPHDILGGVVLVLVVCVLAPIAEETIFRGVLLTSIKERFGVKWAIGISSVVFAVMHLNPFTFVPILLVALVLSVLYVRSGSLWVSIACHSAFNAIGVLAVLLLRGSGVM